MSPSRTQLPVLSPFGPLTTVPGPALRPVPVRNGYTRNPAQTMVTHPRSTDGPEAVKHVLKAKRPQGRILGPGPRA